MSASETRSGHFKPRQSADRATLIVFDSLSKDALADLVIDLLRRCAGDETLDGEMLCAELHRAFYPVQRVRGDRSPRKYENVEAKLVEMRRKYGI